MLKVEVSGKDYEVCEQVSHNMWSNSKTGEWGRGLANSENDPRKVERIGKLGEMALAKALNKPVDIAYREHGDAQDFILFRTIKIDLKTATRRPRYNAGLVKVIEECGLRIPLTKEIYVFGYVEDEKRSLKSAIVVLVGASLREEIAAKPIVPAKKGGHKNHEIPYLEMRSMDRFIELYEKFLRTRNLAS